MYTNQCVTKHACALYFSVFWKRRATVFVSLFPHIMESVPVLGVRLCFFPGLLAVGRISDRTRCSVKTLL